MYRLPSRGVSPRLLMGVQMRRSPFIFLVLVLLLGTAFSGVALAAKDAKERVLVMRLEGTALSDKDKADLFAVIQGKLSKYPDKDLVKPAETAIDELMMEFECFDVDADCLAKLGKQQSADVIFYVQVDTNDQGIAFIVRAIRVADSKALYDKSTQLRSQTALAGRLDKVLSRVFGAPPRPKTTKGRLVIQSKTKAARIFVDGKYAGSGEIRLKKPEGEYSVRVAKDGYLEQLLSVEVTAGATTKKVVKLKAMPKPVATVAPVALPPDPGSVGPTAWYQDWRFWTGVSAVVIGSVAVAAALNAEDDIQEEAGRVFVTINGSEAWRDPAIRALGGAQ